jgi:putative peptidoglycan lipid II flippase
MTEKTPEGTGIPQDPDPAAGARQVTEPKAPASGGGASAVVGGGILLSRIAGLVRDRVLAFYFGTGLHADVFSAGLRMPNVLQNLLGEGTLSASFIPVYSELLEKGRTKEAGRVAGAMFALLLGIAGVVSLIGVLLAPVLVSVFTPGFEGLRRELTITVTRIIFPMTGVLVLSAWALGILNSHRKFFVPYFAPVMWNAAIIGAFVTFGTRLGDDGLLIAVSWGALLGGFLQFGIQLPFVLRLDRELKLNTGRGEPAFREAVRNAGPAIMGRGVVQLSTYVDMVLASLLAIGAVARIRYAQTLYVLPVSLFGMSVAAAELPELSRQRESTAEVLRARTVAAVRRVAFYVVPSFAAFVLLGDVFVAGLFQTGEFDAAAVTVVWLILAAYSMGLIASTGTRVYQSAYFALRDTKTPAQVAGARVATSAVVGGVLMIQFEAVTLGGFTVPAGVFGHVTAAGEPLGPVGLALGAATGAWLEWLLLWTGLRRRIGGVGAGAGHLVRMFAAALAGAGAGWAVRLLVGGLHPVPLAVLVAGAFGVTYFAVAAALGLGESQTVFRKLRSFVPRRR